LSIILWCGGFYQSHVVCKAVKVKRHALLLQRFQSISLVFTPMFC
jgi:hypothetical protein